MRFVLSFIAAALTTLTFVKVAPAEIYCNKFHDSDPVPPGTSSIRSYLTIENASSADSRASFNFPTWSWRVDLKGYLFMPTNSFYAPAIIYSHGGTEAAKPPCAIVNYFVTRGFVFFAPLRRGESPSTGIFVDDWAQAHCPPPCDSTQDSETNVAYFRMQADDIRSAVAWIRSFPYLNHSAVALMGHSNGGIISLLANEKVGPGPFYIAGHRAVVDISGGGKSWCNDESAKQEALIDAVTNALKPMFFLQAGNEPCNPTDPLDDLATSLGLPHRAHIYPDVPNVTDEQAHSRIINDPAQVALWAPDALDFLQDYLF